jgi:hypothetical protein
VTEPIAREECERIHCEHNKKCKERLEACNTRFEGIEEDMKGQRKLLWGILVTNLTIAGGLIISLFRG